MLGLMIILITAWASSNKESDARLLEVCVLRYVIEAFSAPIDVLSFDIMLFLFFASSLSMGSNTSITVSHKPNAGISFMRGQASNEMSAAAVLLSAKLAQMCDLRICTTHRLTLTFESHKPNLNSLANMTIWSVVCSMVNAADLSCSSLLACPVSCRHMSCQIIHGPQNVPSANAS